MIVYKNVCDNCGTEEIIEKLATSFSVHFTMMSTYEQVIEGKRHPMNSYEVTFCSRDCWCSWIANNVNILTGEIKGFEK